MLEASEEAITATNDALLGLPKEDFGADTYIPELIPRLSKQYDKTDNGTVVALITINYLQLIKGESIYIPADGIHAYLSGDIIECMARSNNVLNTGFCSRADRDSVEMFTSCLTFTPHDKNECMLKPKTSTKSENGKTRLFAPPLSEFSMLAMGLKDGETETVGAIGDPSILLVSEGEGTMKADGKEYASSEGYIYFIAHGLETEFKATKALQTYTAFVE